MAEDEGAGAGLGGKPEEVGVAPDPRFTFANERTFLAWNRTSLALIAAGLAVVQLLKVGGPTARFALGLPLLVLGGVTSVTSFRRWKASERALRLGEPLSYSEVPRVLAWGIATVAVAAAVVVVIHLAD